jgi:hypothetical protein
MSTKEPTPPTLSEAIAWAEQRHRHALHMYGAKDRVSLTWVVVIENLRRAAEIVSKAA